MKRVNFIILSCLILLSVICWFFIRTSIKDIRHCVILQQHCGYDNLDGGYYHIKDLKTGVVRRIDVDIRDCNVYSVGDTIR